MSKDLDFSDLSLMKPRKEIWKTEKTEFHKEVLKALIDDDLLPEIIFTKGTSFGKTTVLAIKNPHLLRSKDLGKKWHWDEEQD